MKIPIEAVIAIFGIVTVSGTGIIIALVGFIGKDLKSQFKNLGDIVFKELNRKQSKEICDIKMAQVEKDKEGLKKDIDGVAEIARAGNSGGS